MVRPLPISRLAPDLTRDAQLQDHSLNLRFDLAQIDPRITFARNSTATYFDAAGVLKVAAADEPRIDYDPVTKVCRGLLIEEARTNLLIRSAQTDNAYWGKVNLTVAADAANAPDGTAAMEGLIATTASGGHYLDANYPGLPAGQHYAYSVFVKQGASPFVDVITYGTGNACHYVRLSFTTASATLMNSAEYTSGGGVTTSWGAEQVGGGVWRVWIAGMPDSAATNRRCRVNFANAAGATTYVGDGSTVGVYVWGHQLEAGSFPTSYIPTTTAAVTRAADVATMTGANFSSWFNAAQGTFVVDAAVDKADTGSSTGIYAVDDGSNSNRHLCYLGNTGYLVFSTSSAGASQGGYTGVSKSNYYSFVAAHGYSVNDSAFAVDGAAATTDSTVTLPVGLSLLRLGAYAGSPSSGSRRIRRLTYFPKRLTNAQLQQATA